MSKPRKPLLAANWKMAQQSWADVKTFLDEFGKLDKKCFDSVDVVICPSFFHLGIILSPLSPITYYLSPFSLGSQDIYSEKKGAYTGCVSAGELAELGVRWVILGHSERRRYFKEGGELLQKKLSLAWEAGLTPIFCVGETREERESGKTFDVLKSQIEDLKVLKGQVTSEKIFVVAYEPVWAIGTGLVATSDQAQEAHSFIRERLVQNFERELAQAVRLLYGGSVTPENFESVAARPDVDGGLVGGASLKAASFIRLLEILKKAKTPSVISR